MNHPSNRMPWARVHDDVEPLLTREWLVTNGLGGYAAGSVSGACTRRHHGLLIAALPAPLGRTVMLTHLAEEVRLPGGAVHELGGEELLEGGLALHGAGLLTEFRLEGGLPVWRYEIEGYVFEKAIVMPHMQNSVQVTWRLVAGDGPIRLRMRPSLDFRPHNGRVDHAVLAEYRVVGAGDRYEIGGSEAYPHLKLKALGERAAVVLDGGGYREYFYRVEAARGYDATGRLWTPGYVRAELLPGGACTLVASTEDWAVLEALEPLAAREAELDRRRGLLDQADEHARDPLSAELVLAADQFVIRPSSRVGDATRAQASGGESRSVIAGYPWFTDWGRDTMISLEGLTLVTGREAEAAWILRTFARYVRDGLIPNMFPEEDTEGLYHTADASLWFFHAVNRYVRRTDDGELLRQLLPTLHDIVRHHLRGTRFGIRVDSEDGLLCQGAEGYQLTWMDAKVEGWVVTPRRGKAVEINALWYNALCLLAGWTSAHGDADGAAALRRHADLARESFNRRFWNERAGFCFDVVDGEHGDDPALRPNQLFAISLDHPVLAPERWERVIDVCRRELVTPLGLRSLSREHPDYKPRYDGDLRARDAAYHQGTVWTWLIGPYVDAYLKVHPDDHETPRALLEGFRAHLGEACIGSISEIADAEPPFTPRGCVAQAWGVAEVLRCWALTNDLVTRLAAPPRRDVDPTGPSEGVPQDPR